MESNSRGKLLLVIYGLIAIIVALVVSNIYFINQTNELEPKVVAQTAEKAKLKTELDSLEAKVTSVTESKTQLSAEMQVKTDSLMAVITNLKVKLSKGKLSTAELVRVKAELNALKKEVKDYTDQIADLKRKNDSLKTVSDTLKSNLAVVNNKASNLEKSNAELDNKVKMGAALKLATAAVIPYKIRSSGKEIVDDYAPKVKKVKITFTIATNPLAKIGPHDIYAQVLDPTSKVIKTSDSTTFVADGKNLQPTVKASIDFKNDGSPYNISWSNSTKLQPGTYTVMFYADGFTMGKTTFELKK